MRTFLSVSLLIALLFSCSSDELNNASEINIRLSNISEFTFEKVIIDTTTGDTSYGSIAPGQKSAYKSFATAYRYAFVELEINGETYTLQPIDYVGETPLENGFYTYQLDANESSDQFGKLSLTLIEE